MNGTPTAFEIDSYGAESVSWQRLPDSIESCWNEHAVEEDQMAAKKQKRQMAAMAKGTGTTTKPKPKKKTSRGK